MNSNSPRVFQIVFYNYPANHGVNVNELDGPLSGVREVQVPGEPVHGETLRELEVSVQENLRLCAVIVGASNGLARRVSPVNLVKKT